MQICIKVDISYADANASVGDDYWNDEGVDYPFFGVRARVLQNSNGSEIYFGYTSAAEADGGCSPSLTLSSTQSYTIRVRSEALVGTNYISVQDDPEDQNVFYADLATSFTPSASGKAYFFTQESNVWNITAAASFALHRFSGGMADETVVFYEGENCPDGRTTSCNWLGDIYITPANGNDKFLITHELGHKILREVNGGFYAHTNYSAPLDGSCGDGGTGGHGHVTKEYQSAAADEGLANFYSAVSWNYTGESDCYYASTASRDFDHDGINDSAYFSCELAPLPGMGDPYDHYGDYCTGTENDNRGVEYDWLRFFWDLKTDQGLGVADVFEIFEEASPLTWQANGDGTGINYPATRLRNAADDLGFLTEWDAEDNYNGVFR